MATENKAKKNKLTVEQQLEAAVQKVQQLKDKSELKKARVLKNASRGSSADETRQKILIGAFIKVHFPNIHTLAIEKNRFVDSLKRDDDRALFGLSPLPKTTATDAAQAASTAATVTSKEAAAAPVFLNVGMIEKDAAKALGAKWDADLKKWFVPAGVDLTPFKKWLP